MQSASEGDSEEEESKHDNSDIPTPGPSQFNTFIK
jgi:hypothetical protein